MSQIQITGEISESLKHLEKTSQEGSVLSISKGFGFPLNQLSTLEQYTNLITEVGVLARRYSNLLQADIKQAEALIENARTQDTNWARTMEGSL